MAKRHNEEEHAGNHERWLLTYSDLITLLMIFFIVMYTMSNVNQQKFSSLANSLGVTFGTGQVVIETGPGGEGLLENLGGSSAAEQQITGTEKAIEDYIEQNNLGSYATIYKDERGLIVSLNEALLFDLGSANVNASSGAVLKKISELVAKLNNYITIEGFTDNIPINTKQFPSNWELASQRAINVAKILIQDGVNPDRVSTKSYGEYRPSAPNTTEQNRRLNRRVDIIIMRAEYNKLEPGMKTNTINTTTTAPGSTTPAATSGTENKN